MKRFLKVSFAFKKFVKHFSSVRNSNFHVSAEIFLHKSKLHCIEEMKNMNLKFSKQFADRYKKQAGVLIPLCMVNGEPSVLFTERSIDLRSHKGQVSFPGGVADDSDSSLIETALRETEEEIGFDRECVEVWTTTPMLPGQSLTVGVVGVVAYIGPINIEELTPNRNEVASIFTVPISFLADSRNIRFTKFRFQNAMASKWDYITPVYLTHPKIWGLTACFLDIVLRNLVPSYKPVQRRYNF